MELKSRKNLIMVALVVLISVVGLTYAFFNYYKLSERNLQLITGEIYLRLDDGTEQVLLTNAFPETKEEARSRDDNYVTFSIVGKNTTTNKDIWYEIMLNEGEAVEGKKRLDLKDLRIDLSEVNEDKTEKLLIDAMSFEDLNARRVWVDTVLRNTTEEQEKTYKLRVWIREDILISDTDPNATYTTGEYANNYMSVKVSVFGDLTEKENPYAPLETYYLGRLGNNIYFWPYEIFEQKANITEVSFVTLSEKKIEEAYNAAPIKADVSADENSNVKAWLEIDPSDATKYIMKIASPGIIVFPDNCLSMFQYFEKVERISFENIDTSQVTDMSNMFDYCSALTSLDVSSFDTSLVTNMYYMFGNCSKLTSLDLSNFNTSQVTSMLYMFRDCSSLTSLDLSSFNTSKATKMQWMFSGCSSLTSLDLSGFDTSQVKSMEYMFNGCSSLTSLDLSNFNTSQVTSMEYMFNECSALTSLDVSSFETSLVPDMRNMFSYCSALTSLDLSSFDTKQVTDMSSMFDYCSALTSLDVSSFDTKQVTDMEIMFRKCSSLTSLDLSSFDTSLVTNMSSMFDGCNNLISLNLSNFTFNDTLKESVNNYSYMFYIKSNNDTPTIVTVNSDVEQTWILGLPTYYRPATWTTDNVVIKTA